jgi:hypothetical protein
MVIDKDLINYMHPLIHSTKYRKFQSENEAQTLYLIRLRNEIKKNNNNNTNINSTIYIYVPEKVNIFGNLLH